MAPVKAALAEAVLWPLQYPDTFTRLGVSAPGGALLYGPPGCGKTLLVRALAGTGQVNVLSVKGAELLSKSAAVVTAEDLETPLTVVRPSLDPAQVVALAAFAEARERR